MNEYDSDFIKGLLINKGFSSVETIEEADHIIINTCTVRDKADHKVYSFLGMLKDMKKIIGVVGCMAEKDGKQIISRASYVNFVVGPRRIKEIPDIIDRLSKGEKRIVLIGDKISQASLATTRLLPRIKHGADCFTRNVIFFLIFG